MRGKRRLLGLIVVLMVLIGQRDVLAEAPRYRVADGGVVIENVSAECPIIYDNDWWKDVPDAAYLWAKASLGTARLRGNIVSRDMWNWREGYTYQLEQGMADAKSLLQAATESGLKNIPLPIAGADEALQRPENGKIEETRFKPSAGSQLIVQEAQQATTERPLLVFAGGPCTTVAAAYLTDPSIADRMIVFQIDGGAYNGQDGWSWEIVQQRCKFVNWAKGYFWGDWSPWTPDRFRTLPKSPLSDALRHYASSDLGRANQWGDGAWIFALYQPHSIQGCEDLDGTAITVPRQKTNVTAMAEEFFETMADPAVYRNKKD